MGKVIGIDLGTTYSAVAVFQNGEATIIPNAEGSRTTPSVVAFNKNGEISVGQVAARQAIVNPTTTIAFIKRFMGLRLSEVQSELPYVRYKVVPGKNDSARVEIYGKQYSPEEISSKILMKLKKAAEDYLSEPVTEAVITVPAWFNDSQRQSTKDSAEIAGMKILRIVNEPTAAALAFGLDKKNTEMTVLVADYGGGTLDISVLTLSNGLFETLSTDGNVHCGGFDLDNIVTNLLVSEFLKDQGIDLSKDHMALQRLRESAEKAKIELSSTMSSDINLPFISADSSGPKHFQYTLTRSKFEQLCDSEFEKVMTCCKQALKGANLTSDKIDEIILVGGSTRIPKVQEKLEKFFGKVPNKSVNPDEAVALGSSILSAVLKGDVTDILLLDVTPLSLGIETLGGVFTKLIERNTTIPCKKSEEFSTASDNQQSVEIHILQGERELAKYNRTLGKFSLSGIPAAPKGIPKVVVEFNIDASGLLLVSAKDLATNKEQKITVTGDSGLSDSEIERMVREAEENKASDEEARKLIDLKNRLDSMVWNTEKSLNENRDKLTSEVVTNLEAALSAAKEKVNSSNKEELQTAHDTLMKASHKMAEEMYKNVGNNAQEANTAPPGGGFGQGAPQGNANSDPNVVDATFEDV